jgi:hypothetical protein
MIMRMISVLMAAGTLYFIFRTMQKLLPGNRILQTAVTCGVAFLSTFSFISALVNNDNLANLLSAILIYLLVTRDTSQETAVKWSIKTGIVMAMLALTKIHLLSLFFVVLIVRIIDLFKAKEPTKRKSVIYSTLIIFAIPLVLASWWYVRNYMMFGTFFATLRDAVVENPQIIISFPDVLQKFQDIDPYATMKLGLFDFFITNNFLFEFYKRIMGSWMDWRRFNPSVELMTIWQFIGIFTFTIIGAVGQIKNMYLRRIFKGGFLKRFSDFLASGQGILFSSFVFLLAILTWQIYKMSSLVGSLYAHHGRYFMAAAPALMYMLLRGWEHLIGKKWFEKIALVLIVLFILNDAFALIYMFIPFFYY